MPIFPTWDPSLSVGNDELDEQHRKLLDLIRKVLWLAVIENDSSVRQRFVRIINEIVHLALNHFECEEKTLAINGFQGLEKHKTEHDKYLNMLAELLYGATHGHLDLKAMVALIAEDLYDHLLTTDMECREFMKREPDSYAKTGCRIVMDRS